MLRDRGTVVIARPAGGAPEVHECDSLQCVRAAYPDEDLVICSDAQAAERFALPADWLVSEPTPTISGLSGFQHVHVLGDQVDELTGELSDADALRATLDSSGMRRYLRHVDVVTVADRELLWGNDKRNKAGLRWLLGVVASQPRPNGMSRTLRIYTRGSRQDGWNVPGPAQAAEIIHKLGLHPRPATFDRLTVYLLHHDQCMPDLHPRHLRLRGVVITLDNGLTPIGERGAVRSTLHRSSPIAREEFESWAEGNVVARIRFADGRWVTSQLGEPRPIAEVKP